MVKPMPCIKQGISAAPADTTVVQSSLLQLPLELRRMIYLQSIMLSRTPTPEEVHERYFRAIWEDLPSPLLRVSKQVRAETFDILNKSDFTIRVTSYGASLDTLALSCFIAQQRPRSYSGLPSLVIDIWPPHPDRPIEMYNIYYYLQELRDELRAASPGVSNLIIYFRENDIAKWTRGDQLRYHLEFDFDDEMHLLWSDIAKVLNQFARVTNITKAQIRLPPSLKGCKRGDEVRLHALYVIGAMEGQDDPDSEYAFDDPDSEYTFDDLDMSYLCEDALRCATAQKARARLDAITCNGRDKMSEAEWLAFTEVWPHLETLTKYDRGGAFKGELHYRKTNLERTADEDSSNAEKD